MEKVKWFDRSFNFEFTQNIFPSIIERLAGTPARLEEKLRSIPPSVLTGRIDNTWTIKENTGHLADLEPLWQGRFEDIINGQPELRPTDLQNNKTNLANHNGKPLTELLQAFRHLRQQTITMLRDINEETIFRSALHPRLKTPMRTMDLFLFVADHDDHHLARISELLRIITGQSTLHQPEIFSSALVSDNPSFDLGVDAELYDCLIGSWDVTAIDYLNNHEKLQTEGEWHFSWVLEGRAIQDVWISPRRSLRTSDSSKTRNRYGSTIRFYDPSIKAWRLNWINPVSAASDQLVAKKSGNDIIQEGKDTDGTLMKWSFIEITNNSFHWKGERSLDNGKTYKLEAEFFGKRK